MSNPYYTPSGVPATQTRGVSANMRSEFDAVGVGFDDVYAEILALAAEIGVPTNVTEVPVASSSVTDIGDNNGPVILITGTNAITSFGTNYKGGIFIRFAGILTLTHSASLVLPGAANITTTADDICIAVPIGNPASGWRVMAYCRMSKPLIDDDAIRASANYANPSWLTALAWIKISGAPTTIAGYGITDAPTKTGSGASGSWPIDITGWSKSAGAGADIASAATLDLTPRTGNIVRITGSVATSAITLANGEWAICIPQAAWPLTYHATNMPLPSGKNYTCRAGTRVWFMRDGGGTLHVEIRTPEGDDTPVGTVQPFAMRTAPAGWLKANAAAVSRATYVNLFNELNYTATVAPNGTGGIAWTSHGLSADSPVRFSSTGTYPSGISAGTTYYVISPSANSFDLSSTPGGAPFSVGSSYSGTLTASVMPSGYGDGSTTFNVPELRGEFVRGFDDGRGVDASRVFGSSQGQNIQSHFHTVFTGTVSGGTQSGLMVSTGSSDDVSGTRSKDVASTVATETRPRNVAMLYCIKY